MEHQRQQMRKQGKVVEARIATGLESERAAVVLETARGRYVLQRIGGHPFDDEILQGLVGRELRCDGELVGRMFLMKEWDIVEDAPPARKPPPRKAAPRKPAKRKKPAARKKAVRKKAAKRKKPAARKKRKSRGK